MSKKNKNKQSITPPAPIEVADQKIVQETLDKYKELYSYATDVLLKEHERFNRADEKASKYSTMFFFLIGVVAYFDKWIFDRLKWPDFPVGLPPDLPLIIIGVAALICSTSGLFLAHHVMALRPVVSRPLDQSVLDFFENQPRLNIYYGLAREISKAWEKNRIATDAKYDLLKYSHYLFFLVLALLAELVIMYCLYSWC